MRGRPAEKGAILQRQIQALELRKAGFSYRAIAEKLDIGHAQAHKDVMGELERLAQLRDGKATEILELELERLDMLTKGLEPMARTGNPGSVNSFLRVMERRAKLLGLDAPEKFEDVTKLTDEQLQRVIEGKGGG